jgi:L-arabinose isomerase
VANEIDVVEPDEPLPNLPVARAVLTTRLGADELTDLAEVFSTELVLIDADTTRRSLARELCWSAAYHRLNQRL